jgi:hypothetical protein
MTPPESLVEPNMKQKLGDCRSLRAKSRHNNISAKLLFFGMLCWAVCFWWMHCISSRQDALLKELRAMTRRIEKLSQSEHDLISEVHPQVNEIKEHVENVREVVSLAKS